LTSKTIDALSPKKKNERKRREKANVQVKRQNPSPWATAAEQKKKGEGGEDNAQVKKTEDRRERGRFHFTPDLFL